MVLLLLACTDPAGKATGPDPADSGAPDTADSGPGTTDTQTTDTATPADGVLVLCGGGTEGEIDDASAWSVTYAEVMAAGDVSGDGRVRVAVLADSDQTVWVPNYFEWLGADEAFNLKVDSMEAAEDPTLAETFADVDAVFIKGGDQGSYYDLWNDTELERQIVSLHADRHGGVAGTSAGAMSQSEYGLLGSNDYVTADVLVDSHTSYLDDVSDGGSGIHDDFLGLLPDTLVDTHFSTRGRLGRLAGMMAKAIDEGAPADLLGVGIDEQTCITVRDGAATVSGVGTVVFLRTGPEPALRIPGEPLVWAGLPMDRLTAGWGYDLTAQATRVDMPPPAAEEVSWDGLVDAQVGEAWRVDGGVLGDQEHFEWAIDAWPSSYTVRAGTREPKLYDAVGLMDAHDSGLRGVNDEVLFRTLHDLPGVTGFLVGDGGELSHDASTPTRVQMGGAGDAPMATMVVDASGATWRSLSDEVSIEDAGDGALHPAGLVGMTLHVLYSDGSDGRVWDTATRGPAR